MQVSTALGVILLLISGLGIRFPRGAPAGFDQGKRRQLEIMAEISWFGPGLAAQPSEQLTCANASTRVASV